MKRTGIALSSGEPQCVVPSWESWEARSPHLGSTPSSQSMQPGVNGNMNRSSIFLSTHLSLCTARICNSHPQVIHDCSLISAFVFRTCSFSLQSAVNKHKSALSWFPPSFFHTGWLVCVCGVGVGVGGGNFSSWPNSTLDEIKTYTTWYLFMLLWRPWSQKLCNVNVFTFHCSSACPS